MTTTHTDSAEAVARRTAYVDGLRQFADWLEQSDMDVHGSVHVCLNVAQTPGEFIALSDELGSGPPPTTIVCRQLNDVCYVAERRFGPHTAWVAKRVAS